MANTSFTFTYANGKYVSDIIEVSEPTCIHVEKKFYGDMIISQRTGANSTSDTTIAFDNTFTTNDFVGCKEIDIVGYVYPKQVQLVCEVQGYKVSDTPSDDISGYYVS